MTNIYTAEEIARHNREEDLWIVMNRKVYDLTKFLKEHPGGEEVLVELAGQDGTQCFDNIGHSTEATLLRDSFQIGEISDTDVHTLTATMSSTINTGMYIFFEYIFYFDFLYNIVENT